MMKKRVGDSKGESYLQRSIFMQKIPRGIKALLLYSIVTTFFYWFFLFLGFYSTERIASGIIALVIDLVILLLLFAFLAAVIYRKSYAYHFAAAWFSVSIIISLASISLITAANVTIEALLILSAFAMAFVDAIVLWYVVKKQQHLTSTYPVLKYDATDRSFLHIIGTFWLIFIAIAAGLGITFYRQAVAISDKVLEELKGTSIVHALVICNEKGGMEHDICYVAVATIYPDQDLRALCSKITSDFFQWTCFQIR